MIERLQQFIKTRFSITPEQLTTFGKRSLVTIATILFVLISTVIVAFDSVFLSTGSASNLAIGKVAGRDITAPGNAAPYVSEILTERAREDARSNVQPIYSRPEQDTARTWDERAEQALDFIEDVRAAGRYDTAEQQLSDLGEMEYLVFSNAEHAAEVLGLDDEAWNAIVAEVDDVLERVYRTEIRNEQTYINTQLALQVSSTFDNNTIDLIIDIVDDFVKPNTFENEVATEEERARTAAAVAPVERTFAPNQIIIGEGERIDDLAYEALVQFNLIRSEDFSLQELTRAFIACTITLVIFGLYIARFSPNLLYHQFKRLTIVAVIFLILLAFTQLLGIHGNMYLFPAAALALLFVAIADAHVAVIATLGLAFLIGIVDGSSLETAGLIASGGLMGTLGLQRAERLNQFFLAGILIAISNAAIVIIFNIAPNTINDGQLLPNLAFSVFSGLLLAPATALAAMYLVTMLFNLPTALKLIDLQQPNKPLLQRLLREAPGTYQHSLQVGNLAEQAANAIGADAQLTHVAALYHDIGKMGNPLYFTENQQDIGNPHDTLNDPYRSADIIIGHITEGDEMAKQAGLPQRVRDFIREHHGTTQVFVFYQRALNAVEGDKSAVDISDFTYPGPRPRSKETAILMLADSCEAAVRSVKPQSKQEIRELVAKIIDGKRVDSQLDESGLTLNDLHTIREIFVDILQGMFHPRINYREAVDKKTDTSPKPPKALKAETEKIVPVASSNGTPAPQEKSEDTPKETVKSNPKDTTEKLKPVTRTIPRLVTSTEETAIADDEPLPEVPRLPSLDERRATQKSGNSDENGSKEADEEKSDEA